MFDFVLDVVTVVSSSVGIWAMINTTYRCTSPSTFGIGGENVTFSNMRLEAYMPENDLSPTGAALIVFLLPSRLVSRFLALLISCFFFISRHRKHMYGRSSQHYSSTYHCEHCHNRNSGTNPSRNT